MKHYIATTLSEFWKGSEQHFSQVITGKKQEYKDFMVKFKTLFFLPNIQVLTLKYLQMVKAIHLWVLTETLLVKQELIL